MSILRARSIAPLIHSVGAEGIDVHAERLRMANRVSELDFAFRRETSGDKHFFRDPASHVSRAAIDFAWIFFRKNAPPRRDGPMPP